MAQKLQIVRAVDWCHAEWDCIPTPGEVYVIVRPETDEKYLKIGNGVTRLGDLPCISASIFGEIEMEETTIRETCAQCGHLCIINRNKIYAVCDETGKVFELWHMDTRESDACKHFQQKKNKHTY